MDVAPQYQMMLVSGALLAIIITLVGPHLMASDLQVYRPTNEQAPSG